MDMNDRALRNIVVGLGGRANGYVRETGFDITAASEVMAITAVARDLFDLRKRLGAITVGYTWEGEPVTAEQLKAAGAMTVLLKDAIKPNLVQTLEGQPAFVHCGPFANIAHGNSSLVADLVGLKLGEYVVTESGFGSDMGMEKFLDIVCRVGNIAPSAIVLVATVRALKHHGDDPDGGVEAIERGAPNLARHIGIIREFGLNAVVAVNRMPGDTDDEVATVGRLALELGAHSTAVNSAFEEGGDGARELAEAVVDAADAPSTFEPVYALDAPIVQKIEAIAKRVYGADGISLLPAAEADVKRFTEKGLDTVPICMAKTHLSLSHDPNLTGAPTGFTVPVRGLRPYTGAGLARRALRRHADDARALGDAGRVQRRHRRERPHRWPLLSRSQPAPRSSGRSSWPPASPSSPPASPDATTSPGAPRGSPRELAPLAAADAAAYRDFLATRSDQARALTIELPLAMAELAADVAELAAEAAESTESAAAGDAKAGVLLAEAAARAAALLVTTNGGGDAAAAATGRAARAAARV